MTHTFATSPADTRAIDILWFRIALGTHYNSLDVMALLLVLSLALAVMAGRRLLTEEQEAAALSPAT